MPRIPPIPQLIVRSHDPRHFRRVASLIGLMELLAQTKQTAEFTANMFEAFTLATLIYFVLNMSLMTFMSWVEKKVRIPGMMGGAK